MSSRVRIERRVAIGQNEDSGTWWATIDRCSVCTSAPDAGKAARNVALVLEIMATSDMGDEGDR